MTDIDPYHLWPEFERERLRGLDDLNQIGRDEHPGQEEIQAALGVLGWLRLHSIHGGMTANDIDRCRLLLDDRYDP